MADLSIFNQNTGVARNIDMNRYGYGDGYTQCSYERLHMKKETELIEFIHNTYGDKYDLSKLKYTGSRNKVIIICPIHGEHQLTPFEIKYKKRICKQCSKNVSFEKNRPTHIMNFIRKSNEIHSGRYRYPYIDEEYVNHTTKITVVCPIHGEFKQTPNSHTNCNGCPSCGLLSNHKTTTFDELYREFIEVHSIEGKPLYRYKKDTYDSIKTKMTIVCPIHGEFEQTPQLHKKGSGCPICAQYNRRLTQQQVIEQFKQAHGDRYDYSKSKYVNTRTKIIIICSRHGEFQQTPNSHKNGIGCIKCAREDKAFLGYSKLYFDKNPDKKSIPAKLYILKMYDKNEVFTKIGITAKSVSERYERCKLPYNIEIVNEFDMTLLDAFNMEQTILIEFSKDQYRPNKYFGGYSECIKYSQNIIDNIEHIIDKSQ